MTKINEAKKIVKNWLNANGFNGMKLRGKTYDFSDLAREEAVFITIIGWKPSPKWADLKSLAKQNGFYVDSER